MIQFHFMNDIDFASLLATPLSSYTDSYLSVPGLSGRGLLPPEKEVEFQRISMPVIQEILDSISDMVFTPSHANSKLMIIIVHVYNKHLYGCA